ncbi:MAG: MATE family efflux transporter [Bacteroidales bacterium]|nr:MATE family efflux transporter [Bacteroidales bacterium]
MNMTVVRQLDKGIFRIAVPSILANITVPLVGIADIAVAGHLEASAAALIGGISIGTMLFGLLYWNFEFLRISTGGLTAQAYGRADWQDSVDVLVKGVALALAAAVVILLLQWPFIKLSFLVVKCSREARDLALEYFFVRVWAAPATLSLMSLKGWFIGMQDSISSMFTDLVVNGINVIASIFLSLGIPGTSFEGVGFSGIAWGTVLAQYSGLIFALVVIFIKYKEVVRGRISIRSLKGGDLRQFMTLNADFFVRSLCLIIVYVSMTIISAKYGDLLLASCSVIMQLLMIFSYFTDGFAFSGEAICGKYFGRRNFRTVDFAVKRVFLWSMGVGMIFVLIYSLTGVPLLLLMTSDETVVEASRRFLPWLSVMPLMGCPAFTWDGIYAGLTASKIMRDSALGSVIAFYLVWVLGAVIPGQQGSMAIHVLLAAYFAHLLFRSAYMTIKYKSLPRQ